MTNWDEAWAKAAGIDLSDGEHFYEVDWTPPDEQPQPQQTPRQQLSEESQAEANFVYYWNLYGDKRFVYEREYKFLPHRRFKGDFVFVAQKLVVEVDGMMAPGGKPGAHRSIVGKMRDCRRDLTALANGGWETVRIGSFSLQSGSRWFDAEAIIKEINAILQYR